MVFAFFYGLFSESVPLRGSRKKNYIILMSLLQVVTCVAVVVMPVNMTWSVYVVSVVLSINSMAMCWTDVIVDGLVVKEQRKDPVHGS